MGSHGPHAAGVGDADQVPAWVAYSGVLIVGGTALAVLAYFQHRLALDAKLPWLLSWSFSIGLDWGSVVGGVFWFFGAGALAKWGRFTAVSFVLVSTVLTCIAMGRATDSPWWALLGVIHPAVAFFMAKLLTLWQAGRARARAAHTDLEESLAAAGAELAATRGVLALSSALAVELTAARDAAQERAVDAEARAAEGPATTEVAPTAPAGPTRVSVVDDAAAARERVDAAILTAWGRGAKPDTAAIAEAAGKDPAYVRDRVRQLRNRGHDIGNVPERYRLHAV